MVSFGGWLLVIAIAFMGSFIPLWGGISGRVALPIIIVAVVIPAPIYYYFMIDNLDVSARGMWPLALTFQYMQSAIAAGMGFGGAELFKKLLK